MDKAKYIVIMKKYNGIDEPATVTGDTFYYQTPEQKTRRVKNFNDQRCKEDRSRQFGFRFSGRVVSDDSDLYTKALRVGVVRDLRNGEFVLDEAQLSWIKFIYSKNKEMPLDDLLALIYDPSGLETSAEEYICASVGASVWTYYVSGSKEINGTVYEGTTSYDSKSRRL